MEKDARPNKRNELQERDLYLDSHLGTAAGFNIAAYTVYGLGFPTN